MLMESYFGAPPCQPLICFALLFLVLNWGLYMYLSLFLLLLNLAQFAYLTDFIQISRVVSNLT